MLKSLTFSQKIRSAFAIATVFVLVLATNQLDKQYYDSIKETMQTIHEDRLVAKGYLYDLNNIFYKKQIDALRNGGYSSDSKQNEEISFLIESFASTRFTKQEKYQFQDFTNKVEKLFSYEKQLQAADEIDQDQIEEYCSQLTMIGKSLDDLADIQIGEGESQLKSARLFTKQNEFLAQIELGIIIVVGFVIQFLIFYKFKS